MGAPVKGSSRGTYTAGGEQAMAPARPLLGRLLVLARRAALAALLAVVLAARARRIAVETPAPAACGPEAGAGRGVPPRHWLGCVTDRGSARGLADDERLVLGLPLDVNRADERALAFVPGLSRRLARAVVEDRAVRGPFPAVEALERVRGIGPRRLALARPALAVEPAP